jgi:Domain of unknown function (DUF4159)
VRLSSRLDSVAPALPTCSPAVKANARIGRRLLYVHLLLLGVIALVGTGYAQSRGRFREGSGRFGGTPPRFAGPGSFDRKFSFCKIMYRSTRSEPSGIGWSTDYPYAGINLMIRLSELTKTAVSLDQAGEPNHFVVRLTDDALFECPFTMASDVGTIGFSDEEVGRLRTYLLKGGFLWVDDFWGTAAWEQWSSEISKVLPPSDYPIVDLPLDHPIFRSLFEIANVPQITNIQFWRGVRGSTTSERGRDSTEPHLRAIQDRDGRIMVVITHNTDIGDSWEREGEDRDFFNTFSPNGYALGIDVLLFAMTH